MGKYLKKSKILKEDDADSFRYLQLRSRRLLRLPLLADTKKQLKRLIPRAKSVPAKKLEPPLVIESEKENFGEKGFDFESEAIESVPSSSEIEDFFAYAEQKQERFFIEKYNFDIVSDNPLPGRYEWVKVEP